MRHAVCVGHINSPNLFLRGIHQQLLSSNLFYAQELLLREVMSLAACKGIRGDSALSLPNGQETLYSLYFRL